MFRYNLGAEVITKEGGKRLDFYQNIHQNTKSQPLVWLISNYLLSDAVTPATNRQTQQAKGLAGWNRSYTRRLIQAKELLKDMMTQG